MLHIHEVIEVGTKNVAKKEPVKKEPAKKVLPPRLQSVDEEGSAKENKPVLKEFESGAWKSLAEPYKAFAMDCATKYDIP
ncbi:unnamed protein product [Nippostrongylus brasiliensis]|nr:unnamed protein product [Nippostrongylus brasiliensis]